MNERRVQEERKNSETKRPPEKVMARLKEWYGESVDKIKKGAKGPLEPVYRLKMGAEGRPTFFNDEGKKYELPKEFCAEIYERITSAMFTGGDMESLGALGEDDLLVAAAHDHPNLKIAIEAASVIAMRDPVKKEDLEFLIMSEHAEVRKMAEEHYFDTETEIEIEQ